MPPPLKPISHAATSKRVKCAVLLACEWLGLFHITAWAFRGTLQILCYHGFQIRDECAFRPQLFISEARFRERLNHVAKRGFLVLPLGEALARLRAGKLPKNALVITIDDGFKSTLKVAARALGEYQMPATVYVTTYYMDHQVPVFRLAVQYVFWKAREANADFTRLRPLPSVETSVDPDAAMWGLIEHGETLATESERQVLLSRVAEALSVDLSPLYLDDLLSILSADEVRLLCDRGFDIQLHTHRHRFPAGDRVEASREIEENRIRLERIVGVNPRHFCYPSGIFSPAQWPWLESLGVESATTCLPGLNRPKTPRFGLMRFLDSESIDAIEFRAELAGFNEALRRLRGLVPGRRHESERHD